MHFVFMCVITLKLGVIGTTMPMVNIGIRAETY